MGYEENAYVLAVTLVLCCFMANFVREFLRRSRIFVRKPGNNSIIASFRLEIQQLLIALSSSSYYHGPQGGLMRPHRAYLSAVAIGLRWLVAIMTATQIPLQPSDSSIAKGLDLNNAGFA